MQAWQVSNGEITSPRGVRACFKFICRNALGEAFFWRSQAVFSAWNCSGHGCTLNLAATSGPTRKGVKLIHGANSWKGEAIGGEEDTGRGPHSASQAQARK